MMRFTEILPDYMKKNIAIAQGKYNPKNSAGTHCELIKGRPDEVEIMAEKFYQRMEKEHPTFEVKNVTSTPTPVGVSMFITYKI